MINIADKDPAFLFYSSDFLNGVSDLSMEERGQYITLLCLQHQKGHLSKRALSLTVGAVSEFVISKFNQDESGRYYNVRLEEEIDKRKKHREKQRANINKRWGSDTNDIPDALPEEYQEEYQNDTNKSTKTIPLENENVNVNETEIVNEDKKKNGKTTPRARAPKTELEKALDDFAEMRMKIKKPLTDRARMMILNRLQELAPGDDAKQVLVLEQSILHCWQGVFPLKEENAHPQRPASSKSFIGVVSNNDSSGNRNGAGTAEGGISALLRETND